MFLFEKDYDVTSAKIVPQNETDAAAYALIVSPRYRILGVTLPDKIVGLFADTRDNEIVCHPHDAELAADDLNDALHEAALVMPENDPRPLVKLAAIALAYNRDYYTNNDHVFSGDILAEDRTMRTTGGFSGKISSAKDFVQSHLPQDYDRLRAKIERVQLQ